MSAEAREVAGEIKAELSALEETAWIFAALLYGVGDIVTTALGMRAEGVEERHPISARILGLAGTAGMVAAKLIVLGIAFAAFLIVPAPHRFGIPLGLALLGLVIVVNNATVIAEARDSDG